jgi:uncharacterized membrane protein
MLILSNAASNGGCRKFQSPEGTRRADNNCILGARDSMPHEAHRKRESGAGVTPVVARNIRALYERRAREAAQARVQDRIAGAMTRFAGSTTFVYVHVVIFGFWILANVGWIPGVPIWDPSFAVLAMAASVEAIFLSTFVLITQNRMAAAADKRADLDLQISLLAEHEVTELTILVSDIAKKLGVESASERDIEEVKAEVVPEVVLDHIEAEAD